jgi:streptomycin 6-kinase
VRLIASGRTSEILDLGDGRVLRRFRAGGDAERERLMMDYARRSGYPVPRVLEVRPGALVLDRVEGPTMLDVLRRKPWTLRRNASVLAELHKQLHEIIAPPTLPAAGAGDRLLHLDLHPGNVMLSPNGPFVIDWTNARRGEPALDVALTWLIIATSGGGGLRPRLFLRWFLTHFERDKLLRALPAAAERRVADPHVSDHERLAVRRFLERAA